MISKKNFSKLSDFWPFFFQKEPLYKWHWFCFCHQATKFHQKGKHVISVATDFDTKVPSLMKSIGNVVNHLIMFWLEINIEMFLERWY
jgi:hypothetical protein